MRPSICYTLKTNFYNGNILRHHSPAHHSGRLHPPAGDTQLDHHTRVHHLPHYLCHPQVRHRQDPLHRLHHRRPAAAHLRWRHPLTLEVSYGNHLSLRHQPGAGLRYRPRPATRLCPHDILVGVDRARPAGHPHRPYRRYPGQYPVHHRPQNSAGTKRTLR